MQLTSHAHDSLHLIFCVHDPAPAHETSHGVFPQTISSLHESFPLHFTSHDEASPQKTLCSHDRSPQTTRHGMFGGHVMSSGQVSGALQSITQTPAMHVPFGQPNAHRSPDPSEVAFAASGAMPRHEVSGAAHQPSIVQT